MSIHKREFVLINLETVSIGGVRQISTFCPFSCHLFRVWNFFYASLACGIHFLVGAAECDNSERNETEVAIFDFDGTWDPNSTLFHPWSVPTHSCLDWMLRFVFEQQIILFWYTHFLVKLGYLELTLGDKQNISRLHQEWLTISKESGEFLLETINRILDFQKLEHGSDLQLANLILCGICSFCAGKMELWPGIFNLRSVLQHVCSGEFRQSVQTWKKRLSLCPFGVFLRFVCAGVFCFVSLCA